MAKEGIAHQAMVEALGKRLRQLFPDPSMHFSEGRVVRPVGLKPDIYMRHPDGRQWVFEMVHGNRNPAHLTSNHLRYAQHGIHDTWILWDTLRPMAGDKQSLDQGLFADIMNRPKRYRLTGPQRAILDMQAGTPRHLYAFTLDTLEVNEPLSGLLNTFAIGLYVFRFDDWDNKSHALATREYVPLSELGVDASGDPVFSVPQPNEEAIIRHTLRNIGLDLELGTIPGGMPTLLNSAFSKADTWKTLATGSMAIALSSRQHEMRNILTYLQSEQSAPLRNLLAAPDDMTADQIINDHNAMARVAQNVADIKLRMNDLDMPVALRSILLELLDNVSISHLAELMKWQESSEVLRNARSSR